MDLERIGRIFHALSDGTRLRIVGMLADGEHCVCDLTGALDAAQSRLSFHLRTLRMAGVVRDRREGRWVFYSLVPEAFEVMESFLADARPAAGWPDGGGCCG